MATTHYHRVADLDRRARRAAACGEAVLGPPGGICPARLDFSSGSYCVPSQGAADAIANPANGTCPWGGFRAGATALRSGRAR